MRLAPLACHRRRRRSARSGPPSIGRAARPPASRRRPGGRPSAPLRADALPSGGCASERENTLLGHLLLVDVLLGQLDEQRQVPQELTQLLVNLLVVEVVDLPVKGD